MVWKIRHNYETFVIFREFILERGLAILIFFRISMRIWPYFFYSHAGPLVSVIKTTTNKLEKSDLLKLMEFLIFWRLNYGISEAKYVSLPHFFTSCHRSLEIDGLFFENFSSVIELANQKKSRKSGSEFMSRLKSPNFLSKTCWPVVERS